MSLSQPANAGAHAVLLIGPGKLGLGLVGLTAHQAGLPLHVVARPGSPVRPGCALRVNVIGSPPPTTLDVASISNADQIEQLCPEALAAIDHSDELLICTSVGTSEMPGIERLVRDIAVRRRETGPTLVIAAENDPGEDFPAFAEALRSDGARVLSTMVNRVCPKVVTDELGRTVDADALAEWLIEADLADWAILRVLARVPHVGIALDIGADKERKRALVNGGHIAISLLAFERNVPTVRDATQRPDLMAFVELLHEEMILALGSKHGNLDAARARDYGQEQVAVWTRQYDETLRILRRLHRHDLRPLIRDVALKLGETANHLPGGALAHPAHRITFEALHRALVSVRGYPNDPEMFDGRLERDADRDGEAVRQYGRLLARALGATPLRAAEAAVRLGIPTSELLELVDADVLRPVAEYTDSIVFSSGQVGLVLGWIAEGDTRDELAARVREHRLTVDLLRDATTEVRHRRDELANALADDRKRHER
ncbi:MAG: Mannitol-phosphate 5-dehydrogenase [Conexibacter sp.]|nr:Mannitol-phosphate 5-dehydrogenase [Conexibacter sp.]